MGGRKLIKGKDNREKGKGTAAAARIVGTAGVFARLSIETIRTTWRAVYFRFYVTKLFLLPVPCSLFPVPCSLFPRTKSPLGIRPMICYNKYISNTLEKCDVAVSLPCGGP